MVSSISFCIFLRALVINYKINPGPLNSIFASQLKCMDPGQIKGFALKVAISGHHLTSIFMNVMQ